MRNMKNKVDMDVFDEIIGLAEGAMVKPMGKGKKVAVEYSANENHADDNSDDDGKPNIIDKFIKNSLTAGDALLNSPDEGEDYSKKYSDENSRRDLKGKVQRAISDNMPTSDLEKLIEEYKKQNGLNKGSE